MPMGVAAFACVVDALSVQAPSCMFSRSVMSAGPVGLYPSCSCVSALDAARSSPANMASQPKCCAASSCDMETTGTGLLLSAPACRDERRRGGGRPTSDWSLRLCRPKPFRAGMVHQQGDEFLPDGVVDLGKAHDRDVDSTCQQGSACFFRRLPWMGKAFKRVVGCSPRQYSRAAAGGMRVDPSRVGTLWSAACLMRGKR